MVLRTLVEQFKYDNNDPVTTGLSLKFASNIRHIYKRINKHLFPLELSANQRFSDDFRGNRS